MYDNRNKGTLFANDKRTKDTQPNYTGKINIDGVDYYLSGWIKESKKDGSKFFSLAVKPVSEAGGAKQTSQPNNDIENDSIPF